MVRALDWSESDFGVPVTNPELPDKVLAKQLTTPPEQLPLFAPDSLDSVGGDIIQIRSSKN